MRKSHHGTYKGKICKITLKDGRVYYDRFIQSASRRLKWETEGWVNRDSIEAFEPFASFKDNYNLGLPRVRIAVTPMTKPEVPKFLAPVNEAVVSFEPSVKNTPVTIERFETQKITAFANLLPTGQTLLSVIVPNAVELVRIKHLLGLEKIEQEKVETTRRISMGDRQYSVKFSRICDYCGESYSVKVDKKTKLGKRCCRKPECMTKYVKDWREWKKSTASSSVG